MDLKNALEYLVSLKENKTYEIDGRIYSDKELTAVEPPRYYRKLMEFGSLDAIVKMIRAELEDYRSPCGTPVFVHVKDHLNVEVFTRTDDKERRVFPYMARCTDASFREGWRGQQEAIIEVKSRFLPAGDADYLLGLISRINNEQGVKSLDNGVSQSVTVKKGVSLLENETVKPRINLSPFRTFREVPQPESEFILRLDNDGRVGLFEADGGVWKIEAKINIAEYFENQLEKEIEAGDVVVMI
jgi:hypothetical protein